MVSTGCVGAYRGVDFSMRCLDNAHKRSQTEKNTEHEMEAGFDDKNLGIVCRGENN